MIFKELILKNFKSHINSRVKFDQGTTLILGENGAGKSSIFEGINFALYKKYNTKSLNDLINSKADNMSVTLHFLVGNKEFKVTRTRNHSKSTAELYVLQDDDFEKIVSGDKEVNSHIEELLQIDAGLFLNAIYIKQGEIDSIVTQKSAERKKNISKLLRLDNLETAYKQMPNIISTYELQRTHLQAQINNNIEDDKDELLAQNKELTKSKQEIDNQISVIKINLKNVRDSIADQKTKSVLYQQASAERAKKSAELEVLINNESRLKKQIDSFTQYDNIINTYIDVADGLRLCDQLEHFYHELQSYESHKQDVIRKQESYLAKIMRLNEIGAVYDVNDIVTRDSYDREKIDALLNKINIDVEQTEAALISTNNNINDIQNKIVLLKQSLDNTRQAISTVEGVDGVCPICNSSIDDDKKNILLSNYNILIEDNTGKLDKLQKEYNILCNEKNELTVMKSEKTDFQEYITNSEVLYNEIDHCIEEQNQYDSNILEASSHISSIQEQLNLNNYDELAAFKQKLFNDQELYNEAQFAVKNKEEVEHQYQDLLLKKQSIQNDIDGFDKKLLEINYNADFLESQQKQESELQEQYYSMLKESGDLANQIKYNNMTLNNIDEEIKNNKQNQKEIEKLDDFVKFLKNIRENYGKDGLQKIIRLSFRPQIQKYTQEFFSKFGFDYSSLTITDDYDIVISGAAGDSDVSMISGGERIAVALAFRLGIAQAVIANKIETIMLDEPTVFLDEYRKQEFIQVIQNISLVPQLIIITHDAELVNAASSIINVEKQDGISVVS